MSLKGHLLIAMPDLIDDNFFRSVVLLLQHNSQGAMGLILNRPTHITVADVWKEVFEVECPCRDAVHLGGPIEGPLFLLHTRLAHADLDVLPGVFVSTSKHSLPRVVDESEVPFKLFSGYSGWGPNQLEQELEAGGWLTMPAEGDQVFGTNENLWQRVCETCGNQIMQVGQLKRTQMPQDPNLN